MPKISLFDNLFVGFIAFLVLALSSWAATCPAVIPDTYHVSMNIIGLGDVNNASVVLVPGTQMTAIDFASTYTGEAYPSPTPRLYPRVSCTQTGNILSSQTCSGDGTFDHQIATKPIMFQGDNEIGAIFVGSIKNESLGTCGNYSYKVSGTFVQSNITFFIGLCLILIGAVIFYFSKSAFTPIRNAKRDREI